MTGMRSRKSGTASAAAPFQIGSSGSVAPDTSASGLGHKLRISRNRRSRVGSLIHPANLYTRSPSLSGRLELGTKPATLSQMAGDHRDIHASPTRRSSDQPLRG